MIFLSRFWTVWRVDPCHVGVRRHGNEYDGQKSRVAVNAMDRIPLTALLLRYRTLFHVPWWRTTGTGVCYWNYELFIDISACNTDVVMCTARNHEYHVVCTYYYVYFITCIEIKGCRTAYCEISTLNAAVVRASTIHPAMDIFYLLFAISFSSLRSSKLLQM